MMRDLPQAGVGGTEFLVHFENAVKLRHQRPVRRMNSAGAPVDATLHRPGQRVVAIDGDDEHRGALGLTGRRLRKVRELQRGHTPDAEFQLSLWGELVFEAVAKLL